jgi:hypothetical protein
MCVLGLQGFCEWPNGDTYNGAWKDNRMHGHGEFVWKQKSCRYVGEVSFLSAGLALAVPVLCTRQHAVALV